MSTSDAGHVPEFAIRPAQYRFEDMRALVDHPDLRGDTMHEEEAGIALSSFVALGHVAIAGGDNQAYDEWLEHTTGFVAALETQSPDIPEQYGRHIAELRFYGAIYGRADVADDLHDMLDDGENRFAMSSIIDLCAQKDTNPRVWIERHHDTADKRAQAWKSYFMQKERKAHTAGRELLVADMHIPGSERVVKDVTAGALTDRGVLQYGELAYTLAEDVKTKKGIIDRYDGAIDSWFGDELDFAAMYDEEAVFSFAREVMSDPEIGQDVKLYLYHQTVAKLGGWGPSDSIGGRGRLEIARAMALGEDVPATLQMLAGKVDAYSDNAFSRKRLKDGFTLATAQMYATRGQFAQAAKYLSNVDQLSEWQLGIDHYARKGGDISLVRRADSERHTFDVAMYGEFTQNEDAFPIENPEWGARLRIAEFFEHMGTTPDFQKAREALYGMADEICGNPELNGSIMRSTILVELAGRLLERDPTAVAIGPELAARIGERGNRSALFELFAQYGSKEMEAAGWKEVNRPRGDYSIERVAYLSEYVSMLLASKRLRPTV